MDRLAVSIGFAVAALVSLAALALSDRAGAQVVACGAPATGTSAVFNENEGRPEPFLVPIGVSQITITAEGGHGGEYNRTDTGGAGSGVQATYPVQAGDCFLVYVGEYGYHGGGDGWAKGGDHGTISGDPLSSGNSGAGGGGASAVVRHFAPTTPNNFAPILVAGGGGGGGGDGDESGGEGGAGGLTPSNGEKRGDRGGKGGRGGGQRSSKGGDGVGDHDNDTDVGGGGGGGGGYRGGGGGGSGDDGPVGGTAGGGGGGGGGLSYSLGQIGQALPFTSSRTCVYRHFSSGCHGQVTIHWRVHHVDPENLIGPFTPLRPQVRVLPYDLTPVTLPIVLTPAEPPVSRSAPGAPPPVVVRLELFHRHKGKWRRAGSLTETATPEADNQLEIPVPKSVRKRLKAKAHGRLRIDAYNEATGERIDRDQLRFD